MTYDSASPTQRAAYLRHTLRSATILGIFDTRNVDFDGPTPDPRNCWASLERLAEIVEHIKTGKRPRALKPTLAFERKKQEQAK